MIFLTYLISHYSLNSILKKNLQKQTEMDKSSPKLIQMTCYNVNYNGILKITYGTDYSWSLKDIKILDKSGDYVLKIKVGCATYVLLFNTPQECKDLLSSLLIIEEPECEFLKLEVVGEPECELFKLEVVGEPDCKLVKLEVVGEPECELFKLEVVGEPECELVKLKVIEETIKWAIKIDNPNAIENFIIFK